MESKNIPSHWTFNNRVVADQFDAHVREQLPWYEIATFCIAEIIKNYLPKNGVILDVGASTGNIARSIKPVLEQRSAKLIALEPSDEMADKYDAPGELIRDSIEHYQPGSCDVIVCMLSMMFVPVNERPSVIKKLLDSLSPGGVLLILDKFYSNEDNGYIHTVMTRIGMEAKLQQGASMEAVAKKELSLSGVQRPMNYDELPDNAESFFQVGHFMGWAIESDLSL